MDPINLIYSGKREDVKLGIIESMTISRTRLTTIGEQQKEYAARVIKKRLKPNSHRYRRQLKRLFYGSYQFSDLYRDEVSYST